MAELPGTCTREDGPDGALDKESVGTYRRDGQDREPPCAIRGIRTRVRPGKVVRGAKRDTLAREVHERPMSSRSQLLLCLVSVGEA